MTRRERSYRPAVIYSMIILLVFLILADAAIVATQRKLIFSNSEADLRQHLSIIGILAKEPLLRQDYAATAQALKLFFSDHEDILQLQAETASGRILANLNRPQQGKSILRLDDNVMYGGNPLMSLRIVKDLSRAQEVLNRLLGQLVGGSILLATLLGLALWQTLKRTALLPMEAEIAKRAVVEGELRQIRQDLEERVASRTSELSAANRQLQTEIAERQDVERALEASEERFRAMVETTPELVWEMNEHGIYTYVSPQVEELLGYEVDEVVGCTLFEFMPFDNVEPLKSLLEHIWANRQTFSHLENINLHKAGHSVVLESSGVPICSSTGKFLGYRGITRDITARKEADKALQHALGEAREAQQRIDTILESVSDGIIVTSVDDRVLLFNRAAEEILGCRESDMTGHPVSTVLPERDLADFIDDALRRAEGSDGFLDLEITHAVLKERRNYQVRVFVGKGDKGEKSGAITLMRDVTREREADRVKNEFISVAAHELRSPLTTILGFSQLLHQRGDFSEAQQREFLSYIHQKAVVLARIVDDLLDLSRIESGRPIFLQCAPCDVRVLAQSLIEQYQREVPTRKYEVVFPSQPPMAWADLGKVQQVLENLISNAVKYSSEGDLIRIRADFQEDTCLLQVEDSGIGMTSEQVSRVFDKFYRADPSNTGVHGLGLGMSIVHSIITAHGGTVWVQSEPGQGTTVNFTLPIQPPV